jgi:hypothetical protein
VEKDLATMDSKHQGLIVETLSLACSSVVPEAPTTRFACRRLAMRGIHMSMIKKAAD